MLNWHVMTEVLRLPRWMCAALRQLVRQVANHQLLHVRSAVIEVSKKITERKLCLTEFDQKKLVKLCKHCQSISPSSGGYLFEEI